MNVVKKYKKEAKKLFYISVKNDIDNWATFTGHSIYYGPIYNNTRFIIKFNKSKDILTMDNIKICRYTWYGIPIYIKVFWYVRKLTQHFKNIDRIEKDNQYKREINVLKTGIENIESNFIKEIRKEKLIQIKK